MCVLLGLNVENNEQTGWAAGRQVLSWIEFAETAKLKQERGTTGGSVTAWKRDTSKTPVHSHEERLVKNEEPGRENGGGPWRRVCLFIPSSSDVIMTNKHLSKCVRSIQVNWKGHLSYTPTVLDQDSISEKLTPSSLSSSEDDHVGQEWKLFMNVKHKWSVWTQEDGEQPQVEAKPHDFHSAFTQIRAFKHDPGRCRIVQNQCFCQAI